VKLRVIIHPDPEGGFWAEVPGFPGCVSEGDSLEEVRANIKEAFEGVFEVLQDRGPDPELRQADDAEGVLDL